MKGPIFVVGCDRSGTSLLTLMLNRSPSLKMIFEAGFLPRLKARSDDYGDFSESRQRWYFIRDLQYEQATSKTFAFDKFENLSDKEAETAIREVAPTDYCGAASALYSASAQKAGKDRWGEKMPRYVLEIEWLASAFPNAHIVHIIRDPRAVAASICRAGWQPSLREAAIYWKERVSEGQRQGRRIENDRYHEIAYESLLQRPGETLDHLSTCIDIQYCPEMTDTKDAGAKVLPESHLKSYEELFASLSKPIDPSRAYAWKEEMSVRQIADVEKVAAPLMRELGYDITGAELPLWLQCNRWAREKLTSIGRKVKQKLRVFER